MFTLELLEPGGEGDPGLAVNVDEVKDNVLPPSGTKSTKDRFFLPLNLASASLFARATSSMMLIKDVLAVVPFRVPKLVCGTLPLPRPRFVDLSLTW
jgi:hypothetical protein